MTKFFIKNSYTYIGDDMKKIKRIVFILIIISTYIYTLNLLEKINLDITNDDFYYFLIDKSNSLNINKHTYKSIKEIIKFEPNKLLKNNMVYIEKEEPVIKEELIIKEDKKEPIVYIYNTHQTETYNNKYLADYSITPNVMVASYMLKENLEEYGIYSYVEEESFKNILNKNKWKYSKSYLVSRSFIEKRTKEMPSLKYYIDLHRDSVKGKYTTTSINGISYAKIMLLIGLENKKYQDNLKESELINNKLKTKYPTISRGIYKKGGKGVNGIYNQDFSKYVFLFEIGGVDNNIEEVNNSMTVLTEILVEYIKEQGDDNYIN